jgi:hypothetical protein
MKEENRQGDKKSPFFIKKPLAWGITAAMSLLLIYFLIVSIAESFIHAIDQFREIWYWIAMLVVGFGIQAGLYSYIREVLKVRKASGAATSSMAAAGGISTTSMVACCAHHVTDILPILGLSAAVVFLNQYQTLFIVAGVLSNLIGITLMLKIIQRHSLYQPDQKIFVSLMRLNMNKSLYMVGILSAVIVVATFYMSI